MNISIEPYPYQFRPGRRAIMVDGVRWGIIHMDRHGGHGTSYWFQQEGGHGQITEETPKYGGGTWSRPVKVWSESKAMKRQKQWGVKEGETEIKPIEERLLETAKRLVDTKLLQAPEVIAQKRKEADEHFQKQQQAIEQKEKEEWEKHASEALAKGTVAAILAAMRWAQSQ